MFLIFNIYFLSLLNYCIGSLNKYGLSFKKLIGISFNLQQKYRYKYIAVLSGIKQIYTLPIKPIPFSFINKDVVYDLTMDSESIRLNYVNSVSKSSVGFVFVAGSELLVFETTFKKAVFLFLSLPIQISILLAGVFVRDKSGLNCLPANLIAAYNLCVLCKRAKVKYLEMFCVFDTNSVFLTVCLQKINVTVTSYTSEVPLYKWNKILVADHLKVCLDYQKTEVEMFKQSIIYNTLSFVEPETYYKAKHLYAQDQEYSNKLGFVSTGGWIRNKLDHIHQGLDFEAYENKILTDLNEILKDEKHISLVIYPHPRELENCKGDELKNYYLEKLPDVKFEINGSDISSNQLFNETYLSICFISTLIFERFYAKRKSAIIYYKEDCFPLPYKSDFLAFVQNKTDFKKLIKETFHH